MSRFPLSQQYLLGLQTAVLLAFFVLALTSLRHKAPTFDEQSYIVRGIGYLRDENRHMRVGHPLGLNAWNALLLVRDESVRLPIDDPSWAFTSFHRPAELFMWEIGNHVEKVIFLARLPTIWLGMLLVSVAARWAQDGARRRWAGFLAMAVLAFDPNILAHGRLATTDLGFAFGAGLAGWLLWRFFKRPSWQNILLFAAGFALLQNTKFTAGLFVPLFGGVILIGLLMLYQKKGVFPKRPFFMLLIGFPLPAFLILWAMYGFQIGTLPDSLPTFPQLSGLTLPLAHHLEQLLDIGGRLQKSTPAFLFGRTSDSGWWYYFLAAFGLKTPLPTLLMLTLATILMFRSGRGSAKTAVFYFDHAALLIPALGYLAFALTTDINLGYRQLLPMLPFLAVWIGIVVGDGQEPQPNPILNVPKGRYSLFKSPLLPTALIVWLVVVSTLIFPHYLAFFNAIAGGSENGYKSLVDSNLDWGQDLPLLPDWMAKNQAAHVWLSYFGEARPDYYQISYTGLDSFPPRLMNPLARPFNPSYPAPGIYAISATTLQGVHFDNPQQYSWFWDKEPLATLGFSIFLYEVEPFGDPISLILDDIQLDEVEAMDLDRFQTNQLDLNWTYGDQSRYFTGQSSQWVVTRWPQKWLAKGEWQMMSQQPDYTVLLLTQPPDFLPNLELLWQKENSAVQMRVVVDRLTAVQNQSLTITSYLRNETEPHPLQQFIHLVNDEGEIAAQVDQFDAAWSGWSSGDVIIQPFTLMLDVPPGVYSLWTGLYDPQTSMRWRLPDGSDRHFLGQLTVRESAE